MRKAKTGRKRNPFAAVRRFFRPSMRLYFAILVVFAVAALVRRDWLLGACELLAILLLLLYTVYSRRRQEQQVLTYANSSVSPEDGTTSTLMNMPLPLVIFRIGDGTVLWSNDQFLGITGERAHTFEITVGDILKGFSTKWLTDGHREAPEPARIGDRQFRVYGNVFHLDSSGSAGGTWGMMYFVDVTDYEQTALEYRLSRPVFSVILLDNYEELFKNLQEAEKSALLAAIDSRISEWAAPAGGYLSRYDRDRYIFLFEDRNLQRFLDERFRILDSVRELQNSNGISATVSIGIGRGADTLEEGFKFAMLAIDMALSRGGDQAVLKHPLGFEFYGGKTVAVERRTKVKSRVMASALGELIGDASNLLIMGHRFADLDTIGAAAAICCIARKMKKPARIVVDPDQNVSKELIARLKKLPEYAETFIGAQEAMLFADGRTLLVVVDTNRPDQVESMDLLLSCNKVAVIDHHRRAADYISDAAFNFHEPFASSASELTAELLQYLTDASDILKTEAEATLAGIVLDTKNFSMRTGSRSFEAAAYLRRCGADTTEVKRLMQSDLKTTVARYEIVRRAELYRDRLAISAAGRQDRVTAAMAADELVNIAGITASFVLFDTGESINISARSIGNVNVQVVLEKLGGGGNRATAGVQLAGWTEADAAMRLKQAIDEYLSTDYETEGSK